jgi:hypothetical protein
MNAGFEMIWCNFSSPSIRLLSPLNMTALPLLESLPRDGDVIGIDQQRLVRRIPRSQRWLSPSRPPARCSRAIVPQQGKLIRGLDLLGRQIGKNGRKSHLQS